MFFSPASEAPENGTDHYGDDASMVVPGSPTEKFCFDHPLIRLPPDYDRMHIPFPYDPDRRPLVGF